MPEKKRVLITLQQGPLFDDLVAADKMADLKEFAEVTLNDLDRAFTTEELAQRAKGVEAIITTWGCPKIDVSVVESAPKLKIISHAAGSVKYFINREVWDAGVVVTNAASAIALYVGEFSLCLALALLRTLPKYACGSPKDAWQNVSCVANETLFGKTVGIISLSRTGRAFLRMLQPFKCNVLAYDPYFSPGEAAKLGVMLVSLEELLSSSKVIALHAPVTDETINMLDADKLKLIPDGAVFVNTARGILIDHDALTKELQTGRFKAALDVTHPEPLPEDHPLRKLPNVLITPHIAGPADGRSDMFRTVVDDLKLFWSGKKPKNEVTKDMLETMA